MLNPYGNNDVAFFNKTPAPLNFAPQSNQNDVEELLADLSDLSGSASISENDVVNESELESELLLALKFQAMGQDSEAFFYFKAAAENGNVDALFELFHLYCEGIGVTKDLSAAMECFREIQKVERQIPSTLTANQHADLAEIHNTVGYMYSTGLGVKKNLVVAKLHFEIAAAWCPAEGYRNLGALYQRSINFKTASQSISVSSTGFKKNDAHALALHRKAIQAGDSDSPELIQFIHEYAHNVDKGYAETICWNEKRLSKNLAKEFTAMGDAYRRGDGIAANYEQANKWYKKASILGDSTALRKWALTNHHLHEIEQLV